MKLDFRIIFYNYYIPYRNLFKNTQVEVFDSIETLIEIVDSSQEKMIVIIPVQRFDLVGFDIREWFISMGKRMSKKFLLIGTEEQIDFALSNNKAFLENIIDRLELPLPAGTMKENILHKVNIIAITNKRGKEDAWK